VKLLVNGTPYDCECSSLAALLETLGYGAAQVATAVDGEFVPRERRAEQPLREGMRIDIVAPIQGG